MLIYPPLVIQQPMNKRTGQFKRICENPLNLFEPNPEDWLCYPAKVGKLLIFVYFHIEFFELGFSMCNLFQLADDSDLTQSLTLYFFMGCPAMFWTGFPNTQRFFYDDEENGLFIGATPTGRNLDILDI